VCGIDPAARLHRHTDKHTHKDRQTYQDTHTNTTTTTTTNINKLVVSVVHQLLKDHRCTTISVRVNKSCLS